MSRGICLIFMQEVFGGKIVTDTKGNIVDGIFERTPVSLKLTKKGSDIEGSSNLLKTQLEDETSAGRLYNREKRLPK